MDINRARPNFMRKRAALLVGVLTLMVVVGSGAKNVLAQQNDTLEVALPEVRVSATRGMQTDSSSPFSAFMDG